MLHLRVTRTKSLSSRAGGVGRAVRSSPSRDGSDCFRWFRVSLDGEWAGIQPLQSHCTCVWLEESYSGADIKSEYSLHIRYQTSPRNRSDLTSHERDGSFFLSLHKYEH
jgi:hypothetical protein